MPSKKILRKIQSPQRHWVGDGFHVQGFLRPNEALNGLTTPFLMLDYANPLNFSSSNGTFISPHQTVFSVIESLTINLSKGDLPVNFPVFIVIAP